MYTGSTWYLLAQDEGVEHRTSLLMGAAIAAPHIELPAKQRKY